jgi:hypothetical protein
VRFVRAPCARHALPTSLPDSIALDAADEASSRFLHLLFTVQNQLVESRDGFSARQANDLVDLRVRRREGQGVCGQVEYAAVRRSPYGPVLTAAL